MGIQLGDGERRPAGLRARVRGLFEASHPFPIAMILSLTLSIAVLSTDGAISIRPLLLVLVAMLCSQLATGWSNDYLDRERDAVHQQGKPVAAGLVSPAALLVSTALALAGTAAAGLAIGRPAPIVLLWAGTAVAFAYNLWAKDTALSWLPYVLALAILPPFVWTSLEVFRDEFWWLYVIGAPLAVAVHLANALPDLDSDQEAGRFGLAVRLGRVRVLTLMAACLIAPPGLIALSLPWVGYDFRLLTPTLGAYVGMVVWAAAAYASRPAAQGARRGFRRVAPAAVLLVAGWLASV